MAQDKARIYITAEDKTREAFTSVQRNIGQLKSAAGSLVGVFASLGVGLSAAGFASFVKQSIDAADSLNDMSKSTGVAVESLAGFKLAAQQSGVELETVAKGMQKFSGVVFDAANGSNEASAKIQRLGLDLATLKNQSPEQQFFALAGALSGIAKDQRPAVLIDTLGQKMATLAPLLDEGAAGLSGMVEEGKRLNPITAEMAKQADKFNDELVKMKAHASSAGINIAKDLLPSLTETATAMTRLQKEGHGVLALLRGFAGIGKLPFDFLIPPDDLSIEKRVKDLKNELADMQQRLEKDVKHGGALQRWMYGSKDELSQKIEVTKNQIAAFEKFGDKLRPGATPAPIEPDGRRVDAVIDPASAKSSAEKARRELQKVFDANRAQEERNLKVEFDIEWGNIEHESDQFIKARDKMAAAKAELIDLIDPLEKYRKKLEEIDELEKAAAISAEQANEARFKINEAIDAQAGFNEKAKETQNIGREIGLTFQSAFEDAVSGGKKFSDVLKSLAQDILKLAIRKNLTEPLFEAASAAFSFSQSSGGSSSSGGSGWLGSLVSMAGSYFGGSGGGASDFSSSSAGFFDIFANGGIMTSGGQLPLKKYANGGIANSPQFSIFGEGSTPEAYVPLPDGRSIPVKMQGGGNGGITVVNNYQIDARGAQRGVDEDVRRAINESENRAVTKSVAQVKDLNQRGQLRFS